jgi:hydroxymethylpyrimidine pyrophosphatase-like HAD family hydrolase
MYPSSTINSSSHGSNTNFASLEHILKEEPLHETAYSFEIGDNNQQSANQQSSMSHSSFPKQSLLNSRNSDRGTSSSGGSANQIARLERIMEEELLFAASNSHEIEECDQQSSNTPSIISRASFHDPSPVENKDSDLKEEFCLENEMKDRLEVQQEVKERFSEVKVVSATPSGLDGSLMTGVKKLVDYYEKGKDI